MPVVNVSFAFSVEHYQSIEWKGICPPSYIEYAGKNLGKF